MPYVAYNKLYYRKNGKPATAIFRTEYQGSTEKEVKKLAAKGNARWNKVTKKLGRRFTTKTVAIKKVKR